LWSGFAYTNGNSYSDGGSVGNAHSNGSSVGNAHSNAHSNGDGNWCAVYPDTQTSSHPAAASVDLKADFQAFRRELASETREFSACRWIS
jgi:hypothetical protein